MRVVKKGATSQSFYVEILDSTSTTGGRKTGLVYNTSSLTGYYVRNGGSVTAITLATLAAANSAYSSGGFKEVDATNMPGVYRVDLPDAALASGADSVVFTLRGATGMAQVSEEVQLVAWDPQDTVRGGLTALPNAAAEAAGGLYTRGSGAGQINQPANGQVDGNVVSWRGTAVSTPTVAGVPNVNAKTWNDLTTVALPLVPATPGRSLVVDAAGLADANAVKVGPTGSGTAQTARDIGASVLVGDKTGFSLSTAGVQAIWDALTSALTTSGSVGKRIADNLDAAISSRSSHVAADIWAVGTRLLTAGTNIVLAKGVGLTGLNDLSAAQVNAEADTALADYDAPTHAEMTAELATADDATLAAIAGLNNLSQANVRTALGMASANLDTQIAALATTLAALPAAAATAVWAAGTRLLTAGTNIVLAKGTGVTGFNDPTAAAIADEVHDEVISGTTTFREMARGWAAVLLGKVSGMDTNTPVFRDIADSKNVVTVAGDANGNRTAISRDLT